MRLSGARGTYHRTVLDATEFDRWYATARDALDNAQHQTERASFHWACFLAEQAAQLAMKGLFHGLGEGTWGHDLPELGRRLAAVLGEQVPERVDDSLARLSRHYIATRYPDAHPSGTPAGHFRRPDAEQAVEDAQTVLDHVGAVWDAARSASGGGGDGAG